MDIPDIPDNRPHRKPSSILSYAPTVSLDEPPRGDFDNQSIRSGQFSQHLNTPPNEPNDYKAFAAFHTPVRIHSPVQINSPVRTEGDRYPTPPKDPSEPDEVPKSPSLKSPSLKSPSLKSPSLKSPSLKSPSLKSLRREIALHDLPLLQAKNPYDGSEILNPVEEVNEEGSYDLVAPYENDGPPLHSLERQADIMFSTEHMLTILTNSQYLAHFRQFILSERPKSMAVLIYYLNAVKALKAYQYADSLVRLSVDVPTPGVKNAKNPIGTTAHVALEARVQDALNALTAEELPAFITFTCINITSKIVEERVRGTLPEKFKGTSEALAEVFCLTDPSRPDNPIIFASAEFHRTTQYGMNYVLGRNCRFLQGPRTNPNSVRRIKESIDEHRHHSELFLNYRRDGSPFMNLLQCAPLCDSKGKIRYFIGAQIDVSGLAMEGAQMDSLQELKERKDHTETAEQGTEKNEFQELGELFSPRELQSVHAHGGNLFNPVVDDFNPSNNNRLYIPGSPEKESELRMEPFKAANPSGGLVGVYKNYLLVRPYPSLRILFTSPALQIPGMLQSSFMSRIGDSAEKRDQITYAMMSGRSVTARIRWVNRFSDQGRPRWIHCTPLLAANGQVGVWMVVMIDDEEEQHFVRRTN